MFSFLGSIPTSIAAPGPSPRTDHAPPAAMIVPMANKREPGWAEVADRVFQRRYRHCDVTVAVVVGADGLAVVDTRCDLDEGRELRAHLRELSAAPVRWVVNTHAHYDHAFGNAAFAPPEQDPGAEFWGHPAAVAALTAEAAAHGLVVPDRLVDPARTLDLGDRLVHLLHPGRGHTGGDLLVHVPDADTVLAGDLVEQSGPPAFGADSYPLDWAPTLDALLRLTTPATVVVPGHGSPVDPAYTRAQRDAVAATAERFTALHRAGVPLADALREGGFPYPAEALTDAAPRAYAQLNGTLR